ncbi:probable methyltransferase-like protein 24 [Patella vulgata]|uniref:probable methyltransferase-like protein 24 n=1 Tax=Patella vulgata TaxID=6465 RepID=UPI00217F8456|nr:probable methyltransferase-like protein 24 [Patella vulgata]
MARWRLRTKAIFVYLGSLFLILAFLSVFTINGNLFSDPKTEINNRRKMLMQKVAVDRIDVNGLYVNGPFNKELPVIGAQFVGKYKEDVKNELDVSKYNKDGVWVIPPLSILPNISWSDLSTIYHGYLENVQIKCKNPERVGKITDGGWQICEDPQHKPSPGSLVYSFGINNDFSFDDAMAKKYKTQVHSFDPSIKLKDHDRSDLVKFHATGISDYTGVSDKGWNMATLTDIKRQLGHTKESLSVLKMDIEEWEWKVLPQLIKSNALHNIKQLLIEVHACEGCAIFRADRNNEASKERYIQGLQTYQHLYDLGFRLFWIHKNSACAYRSKFTDKEISACHEIHFVHVD